jgi:hypothetical protein
LVCLLTICRYVRTIKSSKLNNKGERTMTTIKAIVTKSTDCYVPLNTPVKIVLDKHGLPYAIHACANGGGTFLSNKYDQKNTVFKIIGE